MSKIRALPNSIKEQLDLMMISSKFQRESFCEISKTMNHFPLEFLHPTVSQRHDVINAIKVLILLHNMIFHDTKNRAAGQEKLLHMVKISSMKSLTSFEMVLVEKLITPYKLYLLRRNVFSESAVDRDNQPYILINLIKTCLSFVNVIFTVGRYLIKKYDFLHEFNVIIAKDMALLYRKLRHKMCYEFCVQHAEILQSINESLYTVFYNCYFSKEVASYAPTWINTDSLFDDPEEPSKILKKNKKHGNSYKEINNCEMPSFEAESLTNLSICLEGGENSFQDFIKSCSTIATHNESKQQVCHTEKQIMERLDFIASASNLLNELKELQMLKSQTTIFEE